MSERQAPGIYPGMSFEDYAAADAYNASLLAVGDEFSMKHLRHRKDNPLPDNDGMRKGRARHKLLFERDRFADEYLAVDAKDRRAAAWKAGVKTAAKERKEPILLPEVKACTDAALAALANPQISALLSEGQPEVSIFTTDHGLPVKGRIDWLRDDCIADYKTSADIRPTRFPHVYARLRYHLKLGWYRRMVRLVRGDTLPVFIILQEQDAPYDCTRVRVPDEDLDYGEQLAVGVLQRVVHCKQTGHWPGICEDGDEYGLCLPDWALPEQQVTFNG